MHAFVVCVRDGVLDQMSGLEELLDACYSGNLGTVTELVNANPSLVQAKDKVADFVLLTGVDVHIMACRTTGLPCHGLAPKVILILSAFCTARELISTIAQE